MVEHNLDLMAQADWIIDLGPEAGARGGRIVAAGSPAQIAARHRARILGRRWRRSCASAPIEVRMAHSLQCWKCGADLRHSH